MRQMEQATAALRSVVIGKHALPECTQERDLLYIPHRSVGHIGWVILVGKRQSIFRGIKSQVRYLCREERKNLLVELRVYRRDPSAVC